MNDARSLAAVFASALGGSVLGALAVVLAMPQPDPPSAPSGAVQAAVAPGTTTVQVESSDAATLARMLEVLEQIAQRLPLEREAIGSSAAAVPPVQDTAPRASGRSRSRPSAAYLPAPVPALPEARLGLVDWIPRKFESDETGTYEVDRGYGRLFREQHFMWSPREIVETFGVPDRSNANDNGMVYYVYEDVGDFRDVTLGFNRDGLLYADVNVKK